MSTQYGKTISLILLEAFGPVVERVGSYLYQNGSVPLLYIRRDTNLPLSKVKDALLYLTRYQLVTYTPNRNENIANYTINHKKVLLMIRYPKYVNLIKKKFGVECEMMIEELLLKGYWTAREVILKVSDRLKANRTEPTSFVSLREQFRALITAHYIMRVSYNCDEEKRVPISVELSEADKFCSTEINNIKLDNTDSGTENNESTDSRMHWTVNFDRFHQDMRDQLIVNAFSEKFDENAGEFVRIFLEQMYNRTEPWAEVSNPIPLMSIRDIVQKQATHGNLIEFFYQYINVLENDSCKLIRKFGDAGGSSYQIYLKDAFEQFAWEAVEQTVLEKFDSKAARIFRLVKLKQCIEADQIQPLALIPAKEARRLTYELFEHNFLQAQELKKSTSNGPNKCFFLFYTDLEKIVNMLLELCHKTLFNIITRKNHEIVVHKRIIDKKQRVDTILLGMKTQGASAEQLTDIEEMITPPETAILEKVDKLMEKLKTAELEVDETIFLFQMYLLYQ